ncbi:DUF4912 domain-containing protein [Limisalsivibrio acetivorans]|uniref:DUF4912 domain-containing protein n=1 Tax=Limisalsivibrio acetivorans TaxID=1304888 RepID=UPI0003B5EBAC|nr:DUF4912 domain-containing protein [Limisalsivibrio acetivorans]
MNFAKMTKKELYKLATEHNVKNRSKMNKKELIASLEEVMKNPLPENSVTSQPGYAEDKQGEKKKGEPQPNYPIPERYQVDTVVLLPINPKREYVYWELCDKTLDKLSRELDSPELTYILKVFTSCDDAVEEKASVRVGRYGTWYFDLYVPDCFIWAEIGIMDSRGNYRAVVTSRKVHMPSDKVSEHVDEETWMTVGEKIEEIYRLSGVDEMDQAVPGSVRIFQEIMKYIEKSVSSGEMINRNPSDSNKGDK